QEREQRAPAALLADEQIRGSKACQVVLLRSQFGSAAPAFTRGLAPLVDLLPLLGFGNRGANPQCERRGEDPEEKQVAPSIGAEQADIKPDKGCYEVTDADAALHETRAPAARVIRPQLGHHRRTGRPFRADGNADEKAKKRKRYP